MLSKEILQAHYEEYASLSDVWVRNMMDTKRSIVHQVLQMTSYSKSKTTKVAVLGASDKRYIAIHQQVFQEQLQGAVTVHTLDIDTEHLGGASSTVVEHDITKQFPQKPYDIIFSHELMKFLTEDEQLATLKRSHDAIKIGGLAMHVMHEPSILGTSELRNWQNRVDPDMLKSQLQSVDIRPSLLKFRSESVVDWLQQTTVLTIRK